MLLALFRTNQASASLLLFVYALVLQLPYFLLPGVADAPPTGGYLGRGWAAWLSDYPVPGLLVAAFFLTVTAISVNVYAQRQDMARNITQFPGVFVLLCWALIPAAHAFHPAQPAMACLALGLLSLGHTYKRDEPAVPLFNTGIWLGLGGLFLPELLWFLPALIFAIGILRTPDLRSILQLVVGIVLVYFLAGTWAYLRGQLPDFVTLQFGNLGWYELVEAGRYSLAGAAANGLLLMLVIAAAGTIVRLLNIRGSKSVSIFYWLLLGCLPVLAFGGALPIAELQLIALPLGVLLGLWLSALAAPTAELIHLLLFAGAIAASVLALV